MKLDAAPQIDPLFANDLDAKIMLILQRVLLIGIMVGQNRVADDAEAGAMPLAQAVQELQSQLGKLVPGILDATNLSSNLPEMAKSERKSNKRYNTLDANQRRSEDLHDLTVKTTLHDLEDNKQKLAAKIVKEVVKNKLK